MARPTTEPPPSSPSSSPSSSPNSAAAARTAARISSRPSPVAYSDASDRFSMCPEAKGARRSRTLRSLSTSVPSSCTHSRTSARTAGGSDSSFSRPAAITDRRQATSWGRVQEALQVAQAGARALQRGHHRQRRAERRRPIRRREASQQLIPQQHRRRGPLVRAPVSVAQQHARVARRSAAQHQRAKVSLGQPSCVRQRSKGAGVDAAARAAVCDSANRRPNLVGQLAIADAELLQQAQHAPADGQLGRKGTAARAIIAVCQLARRSLVVAVILLRRPALVSGDARAARGGQQQARA